MSQTNENTNQVKKFWAAACHGWVLSCIYDGSIAILAGTCAFLLRFDFRIPDQFVHRFLLALVVWATVKPAVHMMANVHSMRWRYTSVPDVAAIVRCGAIAEAISAVLIAGLSPARFPRSIFFLDFLLFVAIVSAGRMSVRMNTRPRRKGTRRERRRVLIYGAGFGGAALLHEILADPNLGYKPVGLIDDDAVKTGTLLYRLPVMGSGEDLSALVQKFDIALVLIAIPSSTAQQMTRIVQICRDAQVPCKTVPGIGQLIAAAGFAEQIRDISMDDVLGRQPVSLDQAGLLSRIQGETILITGAAGSIGSELCRQIARFEPGCLVGFDIAETGLFHLEAEMRMTFPHVRFAIAIGSVQNSVRLDEVFARYRPSTVYHAAAYKHVPLMEASIFEAVENNILGTYCLARAAANASVRDFVLISSDKAVRPANIMGTTKRVAELVVTAVQRSVATQFMAVRFGNVLGSNGSVVPIFLKQIANGGPVTVTHPAMRRYFMTIPEAAQLVIQASLLGKGGELFVLDMGEPVRIVDLARKLILLCGLRPDEDIAVSFSGTRPGEKLYEELNLQDELTVATPHEKIRIFQGSHPVPDLAQRLKHLEALCAARDEAGVLAQLRILVPEYTPTFAEQTSVVAVADASNFRTAAAAAL